MKRRKEGGRGKMRRKGKASEEEEEAEEEEEEGEKRGEGRGGAAAAVWPCPCRAGCLHCFLSIKDSQNSHKCTTADHMHTFSAKKKKKGYKTLYPFAIEDMGCSGEWHLIFQCHTI